MANRFDSTRIPISENLRVLGNTPYYGANGIQDYIDGYTHDGEYVLIAEDGANDLKNYPIRLVKGRIWVNNHAHVIQGIEKIMNNQFINFAMSQVDFESIVVGCGRAKLNAEQLMDICFKIPNKNEQANIGRLFESLDHLITLHQRKLEKLKIIKKSMLENLFPQNGEKTPKIRFSGFTEDWEQRKLGEIAIFNPKSKLPSTFEYVDLESVIGTEIVSHSTETINTAPSRAQRLAKKGDIFYQTVRPYQKNNYLFEKDRGNYVFSTGYAQLRPFVNERFLFYLIQNENFVNTVLYNCTGTSYPAINSSDLRRIDIYLSRSSTEQKCIGNTIKSLDHLITLHQSKSFWYILKSIVSCTLYWEQRKVIDIAETRRGLTYKPNDICEDGIRVLRSSNINEDTFVKGEDDVFVDRKAINIPFVQNGDILITSANGSSRLVGKHAIIRKITDNSAVHGGFMLLATAKNPQFLNAAMGASWYIKFINLFVAGGNGAIGNLNKNDLDEQTILVPYENEQELIGRFFENLDHLITLHQLEPFQLIFKAIAYRIIDYTKSKPPSHRK